LKRTAGRAPAYPLYFQALPAPELWVVARSTQIQA